MEERMRVLSSLLYYSAFPVSVQTFLFHYIRKKELLQAFFWYFSQISFSSDGQYPPRSFISASPEAKSEETNSGEREDGQPDPLSDKWGKILLFCRFCIDAAVHF
jgi:hypothetical protein